MGKYGTFKHKGIPVRDAYLTTGNAFYVDATTGNDIPEQGDNPNRPFATIDYAIGKCTANKNDVIYVMPGHAETLATASVVTVDVVGISIIGIGRGANRPTFTFSGTAATMVISAANITIKNIITKPSIDSVVSPIVVQAADCDLDFEHQDASATVEAVRAVLTTAAADRLKLKLKYIGDAGGNACVNAVRLVGANNAYIDVDFYGVASTSVVEFHTTACSNVIVNGETYNSGTTDGSKNVIDTVTGSTWYANIEDAAAGSRFTGGSASALASDDISTVNTAIGTINATTTDSLHGKIGTDTELNDNSLYDLLGGAGLKTDNLHNILMGSTGIAAFPAAAAAANSVSLAEVLRYISEYQVPRVALKSTGDLTAFGTTKTLFTVTGDVLCKVGASVDVAVTSTSGTTTLEVGIAGNTASLCVQDAVDNTAFDVGDSWSLITAADANGAQLADEWLLIGNGVDIILTGSVDDITAGDIDFYCQFIPLTSGSSVVAA